MVKPLAGELNHIAKKKKKGMSNEKKKLDMFPV